MAETQISDSIIKHFCKKYNIELEESRISDFDILTDELLKYNAHTNLTAVRDAREVAIKHHADSLALLALGLLKEKKLRNRYRLRSGFPGTPFKNSDAGNRYIFFRQHRKKLRFTELAAGKLGFKVCTIPKRAEEAVNDPKLKLREKFDIAVSRAMANLPSTLRTMFAVCKTRRLFHSI